jgi:L-rhamnose mutarotase
MAEFFTGIDGRAPDEGFLLLEEVFHLEDQLSTDDVREVM